MKVRLRKIQAHEEEVSFPLGLVAFAEGREKRLISAQKGEEASAERGWATDQQDSPGRPRSIATPVSRVEEKMQPAGIPTYNRNVSKGSGSSRKNAFSRPAWS